MAYYNRYYKQLVLFRGQPYVWHRIWWLEVIIAIDRVAATILGAWSDETCSSYAWRLELQGSKWGSFWRRVIDAIMFMEPDHCFNSFQFERFRDEHPPQTR